MYPVLLEYGKIKVFSWGFMLAVAVLIAIYGVRRLFEREGYEKDDVLDLVIILVLAGLLGSRLAYVAMFEWPEFLADPAIFFRLSNGGFQGLVWYGGLTAGILAGLIFIRIKRYSFWKVADTCAPFLALGYAVVRIGCFLNGCCYGKVTHSFVGVVFPHVDMFSRYPTQLFSSAINLLLFALLLWYYPHRRFSGQIIGFYLIGYAIYRFSIEFFRENWIFVGPLSIAQVYSILILLLGIVIYVLRANAARRS